MTILTSDLITEVEHEIGEVAGSSVQLYSEDTILRRIRRVFDLVFKRRFWAQYSKWYQVSLAGSGGLIDSSDLQYIKDFDDIRAVFRDGEDTPLPLLPSSSNPYLLTGTKALYYESLSAVSDLANITKKIKIWPLAATGDLVIRAREYPYVEGGGQPIVPNKTIYFDASLMVHGTCWMCLASEGLNSEDAQKHKELFDLRYSEITKALAQQPLAMSNPNATLPTDWFVNPS